MNVKYADDSGRFLYYCKASEAFGAPCATFMALRYVQKNVYGSRRLAFAATRQNSNPIVHGVWLMATQCRYNQGQSRGH